VSEAAGRATAVGAGRPGDSGPAVDTVAPRGTRRRTERQPLVVILLAPTIGRPPGADKPGYGPDTVDWSPFAGESGGVSLAGRVVARARTMGWEARVVPFSDTDPHLFGDAEPEVQAVLVVDLRALDDPRWRAALERFDRSDRPAVGVVAVSDPAETTEPDQVRQKAQLMRVLERRFARRGPSQRMNAPVATSLRAFDQALDATAHDTRIRLANHRLAQAGRPAEEESTP
jgi:FxsC-like protein